MEVVSPRLGRELVAREDCCGNAVAANIIAIQKIASCAYFTLAKAVCDSVLTRRSPVA